MFLQSGAEVFQLLDYSWGLGGQEKNWYSGTHFLPLLEMPELVEKPRLSNLFLAVCMTILSQVTSLR